MQWPTVVLSVLVVVVVVVVVLANVREWVGGGAPWLYARKRALFSPAERSFLGVLEQAVGDEYRVLGKIRVSDVIEPRRGMDRRTRQAALNRISAKHFDFVLCAPDDLSIVCAVELDDASHQRPSRQERDALLAAACRSASLPLVRVRARGAYSIDDLRGMLAAALDPTRPEPVPQTEPPSSNFY